MKTKIKIILLICLAVTLALQLMASNQHDSGLNIAVKYDVSKIEKSKISTVNKKNSIEFRTNLVLDIFGESELSRNPASVIGVEKYNGFNFYRLSTGARFFDNNSDHLLIFHAGHNQDALNSDSAEGLVRYALSKNIDVLVLNMPYGDHSKYSEKMFPLAEFITPVLESINYALYENKYKFITMSGFSGGGWVTVLYSAIDERIDKSVPIAGSWPNYLRYKAGNEKSIGDFEQTLPGLSLGYLDLYALATTNGRQQLQIFNSGDPCCFQANEAIDYVEKISKISKKFGGTFDVQVVHSNKHEIHDSKFDEILAR